MNKIWANGVSTTTRKLKRREILFGYEGSGGLCKYHIEYSMEPNNFSLEEGH